MEQQRIDGADVLITGGSGVIGSYVTDMLENKFDITVADMNRPESGKVKFSRIDLRKPFSVSKDFQVCIHLGAYVGGIQYFTQHPVENMRDNPRMTANVLDAAINSNLNQVIYTSSSIVYEHQHEFPTKEESVNNSPPPSSFYGMSKLAGEYLCKAYNQQFGLKYTILRPFNVYGPKELPDPEYAHVIPQLVKKVLSNQYPVELYGNGEQTRTFTHGKDAARAYLLSMNNKNAVNETFNVAGNEEIKIKDVLKLIWEMLPHSRDLLIKNLPAFSHDVKRRFPSTEKILKKLDWRPQISFKEGLSETVNWLSKGVDNPTF
jgi:nucleoside-diphosphate-sugar epimerase